MQSDRQTLIKAISKQSEIIKQLSSKVDNLQNTEEIHRVVPEVKPTMQNISPLPTMRITTDLKTTPKVPTASSYPMLKNTKKNSFPVDWLGKLPLIEGKYKLQSVKFLNYKPCSGQKENFESTSYTHQKQYVTADEIDDNFLGAQLEKTESANAQSLSQTGLAQPLEADSTHDEVIKMPIQPIRIMHLTYIFSAYSIPPEIVQLSTHFSYEKK
ncbi:Hypothetical predicted protein [Paramuricea clavata]|uniref:Uncharacterized protein n=1 Tax=Paramuricea clavata TaxID=317549 RepID=A0A6S7G656_PARCT|nr:Hypothetical predicted protein [Paramuricea clavata]